MNIVEALLEMKRRPGEVWARPKGWTRAAIGFITNNGLPDCLGIVPDSRRGGIPWVVSSLGELTCEWEVVPITEVLREQHGPVVFRL